MRSPSEVYINGESLSSLLKKHSDWLYPDEDECEEGKKLELEEEKLYDIDFSHCNLNRATLTRCSFHHCNFYEASITYADLEGCDFYEANFHDADLRSANLEGCSLRGANFTGAKLYHTNLEDAYVCETTSGLYLVCPEAGSFIAWKKCRSPRDSHGQSKDLIVKLEIPADALRSSATTRKCRASYALVLEIQNVDGTIAELPAVSKHDGRYAYHVGEYAYPDRFDENRWEECSHGIHFFITRQEAVNY